MCNEALEEAKENLTICEDQNMQLAENLTMCESQLQECNMTLGILFNINFKKVVGHTIFMKYTLCGTFYEI